MKALENKVAIITGASSGIGKAMNYSKTSKSFLSDGVECVAWYYKPNTEMPLPGCLSGNSHAGFCKNYRYIWRQGILSVESLLGGIADL